MSSCQCNKWEEGRNSSPLAPCHELTPLPPHTHKQKGTGLSFPSWNVLLWSQKQLQLFLKIGTQREKNGLLNNPFVGRYTFTILLTRSRFWWGSHHTFKTKKESGLKENIYVQCACFFLLRASEGFPGHYLNNAELRSSRGMPLKCAVGWCLWAFDGLL